MPRSQTPQGAVLVVLGEDDHDRKSIKSLVHGLRPDIPLGSVKPLKSPMALVKDLAPSRLPGRAARVAAVLRAVNVRQPIWCVFMHEDADDVEPAHETVIARIELCYKDLPWPVYAVVPAWELETWWFLFPAAVAAVRQSWRAPMEYANKDLGRVRNAKEKLKSAVRQPGSRQSSFPAYSEADSPRIAEKVVQLGLLTPPWFARSASWETFVAKVTQA